MKIATAAIARFAAVVAVIAVALFLGQGLAGVPTTAEDWAPANLTATPGAGRDSATDDEAFTLEPALRTVPTSDAAGGAVSLHAQDFPNPGTGFTSSKIAGQRDVKVAANGATLLLSQNLARSNERITIIGYGFSSGHGVVIDPADIRLDGVPVPVDGNSLRDGKVAVSYTGQFVTTIRLWRDDAAATKAGIAGNDNPATIAGGHTIEVRDSNGFYGSTTIVIKEPSLSAFTTPSLSTFTTELHPKGYLTITGADWPEDSWDTYVNPYNSDTYVRITVENRTYGVIPDGTGRFSLEHYISRDASTPSIQQVRSSYGYGQIVKTARFAVLPATVAVSPAEGQPGDKVTLTIRGMPVYTDIDEITIGGADFLGAQAIRTDRDGAVTTTVAIPGLDPGTYPVVAWAGSGTSQTVAFGRLTVTPEVVPGACPAPCQ